MTHNNSLAFQGTIIGTVEWSAVANNYASNLYPIYFPEIYSLDFSESAYNLNAEVNNNQNQWLDIRSTNPLGFVATFAAISLILLPEISHSLLGENTESLYQTVIDSLV